MFPVLTGSFRDIESAILADLAAAKRNDPLAKRLVLIPSGHLRTHLQSQLAGQNSFLNIHFLDFQGLAERIMEERGPGEGRVVREPALVREILHDFLEGKEEIPFLSRKTLVKPGQAIPRGLPGALASTLKDLQDSGAKVVDLAQVAREGHLGDALEDAIPILELNVLLYDVLRKRGLRVNADLIRRAGECAAQNPWIRSFKSIFIYGFYDMTGVQLELALALASHPDARVYFPYEEGNPAYGFAEKLLKDPAFASKCKPHPTPLPSGEGAARPGEAKTDVWSCSGTHDEIWLTAKKILELTESGVPYHEMCLTARTLDPYLGVIREVLEAHHIPYSLHAEEPVGAWPIVKAVRAVLAKSDPRGEGTWSMHVGWALAQLDAARLISRDAADTERKIWDGIRGAIEPLKELDALGRPVSRARFLEVMEEKLDRLRLALAPDNNAGVQVMDVMTARGLSFDAVFLVGLNEKLFPRLIREDPFLSDTARSGLAGALGSRLGRKLDGYQEEKLLFEFATQSARKHLHLSCQRSDEEGKALVISLYLHDFLQKHSLLLKRLPRTWPDKLQHVAPQTLTPKEVSVALQRENRDTEVWYRALGWDMALMVRLLKSQSDIEAFGPLGSHDGVIGKGHPLARALLSKGLSPNTLKDLAECPFKVFSRKILALDPEEHEVEEGEITRAMQGKLIHKILEAFYRENPAKWEEGLEKIAKRTFRTFDKDHKDLYPLAWQAAQEKIMSMLKRFIPLDLAEMRESGYKPKEYEISMSAEAGKPPVLLQGRIDRLDEKGGSLRVVDYKTGSGGIGKKEKVETAILKGKNFQLPVYLALAKADSAVFYRLEEGDEVEIDSDFWEEYGDHFYKNLYFLVKDIESGTFYIRPSDSHGYCSWCHFAAICRKTHKPTQIRSESSPQGKAHEECFK